MTVCTCTPHGGEMTRELPAVPDRGTVFAEPGHTTIRRKVCRVDPSATPPKVWMTDLIPKTVSDSEVHDLWKEHGTKWDYMAYTEEISRMSAGR